MGYNYDPELADMVPLLPTLGFDDPKTARAGMDEMIASLNIELDLSGVNIEDKFIPGLGDADQVKVRIYSPKNSQDNQAGLLYIHGGGFAVGSLESEHSSAASICQKLGVVVVSIAYRLAPEDPFPAGLEDCYASLQWLHDEAESLNVDADRIGVIGQSAGGGLAAALTLMTRDKGGPALCFQCLGMPELDDRLDTPSMQQFVNTPLWNRPNAILSWKFYLGENCAPGSTDVSIYAAPSRAIDVSKLPPAYITAMEFDPLRDEAILYGMKLLAAGVAVELHTYPGTFHGSSLITHAAVSQRTEKDMIEALKRGLKLRNP